MKKLFTVLLAVLVVLTLSGCSYLPGNGQDSEEILEHLDEIEESLPFIIEYGGEDSYNHISDGFEEDYNLDGEFDEEELLMSYNEMLEYFDYNHIVTLSLEDASNMEGCIDQHMDEEYIAAAIYAIEYYNDIEWFNLSHVTKNDCDEYRFSFTGINEMDLYTELLLEFIDYGYEETLATEMARDFASNGIAYNSLGIDYENENFENYGETHISFIIESMEDMTDTEMEFIALHELSHSFGLDDIYDTDFIGISLMYGAAEGQGELIPELRAFDLYNLAYIYNIIEEEEVE